MPIDLTFPPSGQLTPAPRCFQSAGNPSHRWEGARIHSGGRRDHCFLAFALSKESTFIRTSITAAALALLAATNPGFAGHSETPAPNAAAPAPHARGGDNRLMIVNGYTGRMVYDDGRDDMFCVTRGYFVGWDYYGRQIFRGAMACR
jgi:hypothetical protein